MSRFIILAMAALSGAIVLIAGAGLYLTRADASMGEIAGFRQVSVDLPHYQLYDMGVADVDQDQDQDVFTLNHSSQQVVLINESGEFGDRISVLGLGQDRQFPFVEDTTEPPALSDPGVYVYRVYRTLRIVSHALDSAVSGSITLPWPMQVLGSNEASHAVENQAVGEGTMSTISFTLQPGGQITVNGEQDIVELPHDIQFDAPLKPSQIFIGRQVMPMRSLAATLQWRDRHSMAWHDVNGDGQIDVFVGRGGVKGQLDAVPRPISDELFLGGDNGFANSIHGTGMESKGICPGRQSLWVDHDGNGLMDLHVSCGRGKLDGFPNQLFSQTAPLRFEDRAAAAGLDYGSISVSTWFDVDQDGDQDLLSIDGPTLQLHVNDAGKFQPTVLKDNLETDYPQIALGDFDNDGDNDALAVSRVNSILLINDNGTLRLEEPETLGLPDGGRSATWVDVDNDGWLDMHALPGGIYRQSAPGQFVATQDLLLPMKKSRISGARCAWFDMDSNGSRDVLCAVEMFPRKLTRVWKKLNNRNLDTRYWTSFAYQSEPPENHWLQVQLIGDATNREAIGAEVTITTADGSRFQSVGSAEGSHYSQGHYRLYFGLGERAQVEELSVRWPDGSRSTQQDVPGDQLLVINKAVEQRQ